MGKRIQSEYSIEEDLRGRGIIYSHLPEIERARLEIFFSRVDEENGYIKSEEVLTYLFAITCNAVALYWALT